MEAQTLDKYIVADPEICHGKPTFRGTRIMVWQVLEMFADGMTWDAIVDAWDGSFPQEAIAEALEWASTAFRDRTIASHLEPTAA